MAGKSEKSMVEKSRPVELELRLAGDPKILNAIFTSPSLAPAPGQDEDEVVDLESRYFDS